MLPALVSAASTFFTARASTAVVAAHTGFAIDTWATAPWPKKLLVRCLVMSINWSGSTMSSGLKSSRKEPTADTDRT